MIKNFKKKGERNGKWLSDSAINEIKLAFHEIGKALMTHWKLESFKK